MNNKRMIFAVVGVFLAFAVVSQCQAVDTGPIDKVRDKGVLDDSDLQIIGNFVADAVGELVKTEDFTSIAKIRTVILSRSSSSKDMPKPSMRNNFLSRPINTYLMHLRQRRS